MFQFMRETFILVHVHHYFYAETVPVTKRQEMSVGRISLVHNPVFTFFVCLFFSFLNSFIHSHVPTL